MSNSELAMMSVSYEAYCKAYDKAHSTAEVKRVMTIEYPDGVENTIDMSCFSLSDLINVSKFGGVVIGYGYDTFEIDGD